MGGGRAFLMLKVLAATIAPCQVPWVRIGELAFYDTTGLVGQ